MNESDKLSHEFVSALGYKYTSHMVCNTMIRIFWIEKGEEKFLIKTFLSVNEVECLKTLNVLHVSVRERFGIHYDLYSWKNYFFGTFPDYGITMFDYYQTHGFDLPQFKGWIWEILKSLYILKRHRYVHGDIKPTNICLFENKVPILIDFGLSEKYGTVCRTKEDIVAYQTYCYTPPEFAQEKVKIKNEAPDVYGLGVTILAIVSKATMNKRDDIEKALKLIDDPILKTLLIKMTHTDPLQRPSLLELFCTDWFHV